MVRIGECSGVSEPLAHWPYPVTTFTKHINFVYLNFAFPRLQSDVLEKSKYIDNLLSENKEKDAKLSEVLQEHSKVW